jgi:predicted ATP-dependent endonuclease of OLD family
LRLLNRASGVSSSIRDVGFGLSQVLPVLLQGLLADEGDTVLIEQPELHLHPRLQAELADLFIVSAFGDPDADCSKTFIIETHSEHLLLRLMRRMRETSRGTLQDGIPPVKPQDVSIIYVQPTDIGSVPLVMDLDEDGELLTAWPNGFFEEGFHERFA